MSDYPPPKFTGYFSNYLFNITTYKLESYCQMGRHEKAKKCAKNVVIYSYEKANIIVIEGYLNPTTGVDLAVGGTLEGRKIRGHFL